MYVYFYHLMPYIGDVHQTTLTSPRLSSPKGPRFTCFLMVTLWDYHPIRWHTDKHIWRFRSQLGHNSDFVVFFSQPRVCNLKWLNCVLAELVEWKYSGWKPDTYDCKKIHGFTRKICLGSAYWMSYVLMNFPYLMLSSHRWSSLVQTQS